MISAENLSKAFGANKVLDGLQCHIADGCIYGLVGANGAGKSTFLRIASGIYAADKGKVLFDGKDVFDNVDVKSRICFVSDDFYFPKGSTVDSIGALYESFYPTFDRQFFRDCCDTLKLSRRARVATFSKGMRRQVSLLCALATRCEYLFFDETFDGLDPVVRNYMKRLICSAVADKNATVILTSHNLRELEDICDHLGILYKGGILFEGDVNNIKTSVCKVQCAFSAETGDVTEGLDVLDSKAVGSLRTLILRGDPETVKAHLMKFNPVLLEVLPLTLEEIFIYEMEVLGYAFNELNI